MAVEKECPWYVAPPPKLGNFDSVLDAGRVKNGVSKSEIGGSHQHDGSRQGDRSCENAVILGGERLEKGMRNLKMGDRIRMMDSQNGGQLVRIRRSRFCI